MSCVTLQATVLALSQAPTFKHCQDTNNNSCGPLASVLALKMMSSRCSLSARIQSAAGPKRCLFGAPSLADTQRLVREDQEAVRSRIQRRWGWDLSREQPSPSSSWQWEAVKSPARRHPYVVRASPKTVATPKTAVATPKTVSTPVPAMLSPLPATPTALDSSASSSSSGTSTMPASPSSPGSPLLPSLPVAASSWGSDSESEDSCCGDSDTSSEPSPRPAQPAPVQTRITDFWRTRRCSTSEGTSKAVPASAPASARTCSV